MATNLPIFLNLYLSIKFKGRYLTFIKSFYANPHSLLKKWLLDFKANFRYKNKKGKVFNLKSIFYFINQLKSIN